MAKDASQFEIPPEMRNAAEHGVVQARQAFDQFMSAAQKTLAQMEQRAAAVQEGAKGAGAQMMDFAEQNVSNAFDFAQRLVRAKDLEEMTRIQAEFVRSQMAALTAQSQELGKAVTEAVRPAPGKTSR